MTNFIILSRQRSASTTFELSLNQNPRVHCLDEMLNTDTSHGDLGNNVPASLRKQE